MNYKKANKQLSVNTGEITVKNGIVYVDNKIVHKKVSHIFVYGDVKISSKAILVLAELRICVIFTYKGRTKSVVNFNNSLSIKRKQLASMTSPKPKRKLLSIRNWALKIAKLPELKINNNFLLSEARHMRSVYLKLQVKHKLTGNKKQFGQETNLHTWWHFLYGEIDACLVKMGADPDIGYIHKCSKSLTYDISDCIKPLFIDDALGNSEVIDFYKLFNKYKLKKLLPLMILWILDIDTQCSWHRSRLYHDFVRRYGKTSA